VGLFDDENPKEYTLIDWVIVGFLIGFVLYMIWQIFRAGRFW